MKLCAALAPKLTPVAPVKPDPVTITVFPPVAAQAGGKRALRRAPHRGLNVDQPVDRVLRRKDSGVGARPGRILGKDEHAGSEGAGLRVPADHRDRGQAVRASADGLLPGVTPAEDLKGLGYGIQRDRQLQDPVFWNRNIADIRGQQVS